MDVLQGIGEMLFFIKVAEKHPEGVFNSWQESVEGDLESADGRLLAPVLFHLRQRQHLLEQGDDDQLSDVRFCNISFSRVYRSTAVLRNY